MKLSGFDGNYKYLTLNQTMANALVNAQVSPAEKQCIKQNMSPINSHTHRGEFES